MRIKAFFKQKRYKNSKPIEISKIKDLPKYEDRIKAIKTIFVGEKND